MKTSLLALILVGLSSAGPVPIEERQNSSVGTGPSAPTGSGSGGDGGGSPTTTSSSPGPTGDFCRPLWGQCGGTGWSGATCCSQGTCKYLNQWHSQCLN